MQDFGPGFVIKLSSIAVMVINAITSYWDYE